MKSANEARSKFWQRLARRSAVSDSFIVDIGQVHHSIHLKPARFQMALQQVLKQKRSQITDVRVGIYSRPAGVHRYLFSGRIDWLEWFNRPRVGIVELNHAGFALSIPRLITPLVFGLGDSQSTNPCSAFIVFA
jgi:hypothetical protein